MIIKIYFKTKVDDVNLSIIKKIKKLFIKNMFIIRNCTIIDTVLYSSFSGSVVITSFFRFSSNSSNANLFVKTGIFAFIFLSNKFG